MRDISLHILDLIENSTRAGASLVLVVVEEDPSTDRMRIVVEDNGQGLPVGPEAALDPFFTTKEGKRTGLGLSLLRSTAEQAGGDVRLRESALGGLAVEATMRLGHVDRIPLGDVAATVSSVVCTNPDVDLWCRLRVRDREHVVRVSEIVKELPIGRRGGLVVARRVAEEISAALTDLDVQP